MIRCFAFKRIQMKRNLLVFAFFCLLHVNKAWAANCSTTGANTAWDQAATWGCGHVPTYSLDNIIINHTINSSANLSFFNQSITLNSSGSLKINGNLILSDGSVMTINGSSLEVTGNLTLTNGSRLILNGGTVTVKDQVIASGNGGHIDIQSGTMSVKNAMQITAGNSSLKNQGTLTSGDLTVNGGGTSIINSGTIAVTGTTTVNTIFTNTGAFSTSSDLKINGSGRMTTTSPGTVNVQGGMTVSSGGYYTQVSGKTYVKGDVLIDGGSEYVMNNGTATIDGNLTVGGNKLTMDGQMTVAKTFINKQGATIKIGTSSANSGSTLTAKEMQNSSTINGYGWLAWGSGGFKNVTWGAQVLTIPGNNVNYPVVTPLFNPFSLSTGSGTSPLPIHLLDFAAHQQGKHLMLSWTTNREENFQHFVVERSEDATTFYEIGQVKGNGNSTSRNKYSFLDTDYSLQTHYYRLKAVDIDGYAEYFKIISAKVEVAETYQMYPNPVKDQPLSIFIQPEGGTNSVSLYNKESQIVFKSELQSGLNQVDLTGKLLPGIYFAVISTSEGVFQKKLIVE